MEYMRVYVGMLLTGRLVIMFLIWIFLTALKKVGYAYCIAL